MDKTNSISDLLALEVCLTSQIHNFVNECEREWEAHTIILTKSSA